MDKISPKALRAQIKVSQSEMAKIVGISTKTYGRKERGEIDWKFAEIEAMCDYAHISIERIEA